MPDMDGLDAVAEICRTDPLPVILISAYHDPELIARAEANQVLAYRVSRSSRPTWNGHRHRDPPLRTPKPSAATRPTAPGPEDRK